jgi:hypothetical protein
MTLKQLNTLSAERQRLAKAFQNLIASRNILKLQFQVEYERHVKLTSKKEDARAALLGNLSRSRNMKKYQTEFLDIKRRIKENQTESKQLKKGYQLAQRTYEDDIILAKIEAKKALCA